MGKELKNKSGLRRKVAPFARRLQSFSFEVAEILPPMS